MAHAIHLTTVAILVAAFHLVGTDMTDFVVAARQALGIH